VRSVLRRDIVKRVTTAHGQGAKPAARRRPCSLGAKNIGGSVSSHRTRNRIRPSHDFWLTRNHHGAGFWDRKLEDERGAFAMQLLTEASHRFGEIDLYIGDDRQLHFSNERRVL